MPTLIKPNRTDVIPRNGFIYVHPETHEIFRHNYYDELKKRVLNYFRLHNYPIGIDWDRQFDENVCRNSPHLDCTDFNPDRIDISASLSLSDIVRGTSVLGQFEIAGSPIVTQAEAERRAGICVRCPHNVTFSKSCRGICDKLKQLVFQIVGNRTTSKDSQLHSCRICKCYNVAQVHLPLDILRSEVTPEMDALWPEFCWKKEAA